MRRSGLKVTTAWPRTERRQRKTDTFHKLTILFLAALVRCECCQPLVAPLALVGDFVPARGAAPGRCGLLPGFIVPHRWFGQVAHVLTEPRCVTCAVVGDPAGGIQFDGLERSHERPA